MQFLLKITFIFGCLWFSPVDCYYCHPFKPCPPITLLGNTNELGVLQSLVSGTILDLWARPKAAPSKSIDNMEAALISMFNSGNCDWQNTTLGSTYLYWILVPQVDRNPGLCTYAAIAESVIDDSCEAKKKAFQGIPAAFTSAAQLITASALENSGCGNSTYKAPTESCPNDGRQIDIHSIIKKIDDKYPSKFIHALKDICKSQKVQDQIMCVATASTTLPEFRALIGDINDELRLSFFQLFLSPAVHQSCCPDFKAQLNHLLSLVDAEVQRVTNLALSRLPC